MKNFKNNFWQILVLLLMAGCADGVRKSNHRVYLVSNHYMTPETNGETLAGAAQIAYTGAQKSTVFTSEQVNGANINIDASHRVSRDDSYLINGSLGLFKRLDFFLNLDRGPISGGFKYLVLGEPKELGTKFAISLRHGRVKSDIDVDDEDDLFIKEENDKLDNVSGIRRYHFWSTSLILGHRYKEQWLFYSRAGYYQSKLKADAIISGVRYIVDNDYRIISGILGAEFSFLNKRLFARFELGQHRLRTGDGVKFSYFQLGPAFGVNF